MIARKPRGYLLGVVALIASCGGHSESGSPPDANSTGGVLPASGSASISGSSGSDVGGSQAGGQSSTPNGSGGRLGGGGQTALGGSSAGTSGGSGAGTTSEPLAGAGGVEAASEVDQYRACVEYFVAQCGRRSACSQSSPESSCLASTLPRCPDLLFAPGSRLSVPIVERCAQAWKDAACDDINRGALPECGYSEGAAETGMPCAFSSQCATLACGRFNGRDCGVCLPLLKQGDDCAAAQGACPAGMECTGTCQPSLRFGLPPNSACKVVAQCEEGYVCRSSAPGAPTTCLPLLRVGETCAASWECGEGYCDESRKQCTGGAAPGAACPQDGWGHLRSCATNAICDDRTGSAVCVARVAASEACWLRTGVVDTQGNCADDLRCLCSNASCTEHRCRFERKAGEPCGRADEACITGTECRAGVCEPIGSQGLFQDACEP